MYLQNSPIVFCHFKYTSHWVALDNNFNLVVSWSPGGVGGVLQEKTTLLYNMDDCFNKSLTFASYLPNLDDWRKAPVVCGFQDDNAIICKVSITKTMHKKSLITLLKGVFRSPPREEYPICSIFFSKQLLLFCHVVHFTSWQVNAVTVASWWNKLPGMGKCLLNSWIIKLRLSFLAKWVHSRLGSTHPNNISAI